jgi:hypothetical protein
MSKYGDRIDPAITSPPMSDVFDAEGLPIHFTRVVNRSLVDRLINDVMDVLAGLLNGREGVRHQVGPFWHGGKPWVTVILVVETVVGGEPAMEHDSEAFAPGTIKPAIEKRLRTMLAGIEARFSRGDG